MKTLQMRNPFFEQKGLPELNEIAVRFEEDIYSAAACGSDYLREISLKLLTMGARSLSPADDFLETNAGSNSSDLAQTGITGAGDWQEEVYQKIKSMKDLYLLEMNEVYMKISTKLQQLETLPQQPQNKQSDSNMLKIFKPVLEGLIQFVQLSKKVHYATNEHADLWLLILYRKIIALVVSQQPVNLVGSSSLQIGVNTLQSITKLDGLLKRRWCRASG